MYLLSPIGQYININSNVLYRSVFGHPGHKLKQLNLLSTSDADDNCRSLSALLGKPGYAGWSFALIVCMSCVLSSRRYRLSVAGTTVDNHFHSLMLVNLFPTIAKIALANFAYPLCRCIRRGRNVVSTISKRKNMKCF